MKRKILALLLSLAMLLSIGGMVEGTLAVGISVDSTRSSVTLGEVDPVPTPTPEDEFTVEPEGTPEGTPGTTPGATPAPEATPEATPTPTVEPTPAPTEEPTPAPEPKTEPSLFERLMACTTLEELFTLADETPEEELLALTDEENAKIEAKIAALEPEPLPAVVIEESSDEPVPSEIIYPTVNFDEVAPFGDPVVGGEG